MVTKTSSTGRDSDKFMLRLPDGVRERIAEAAKANNRTMNAELVARILKTLDESPTPSVEQGGTIFSLPPMTEETLEAMKRIEWKLETLAQGLQGEPRFSLPPADMRLIEEQAKQAPPRAARKK
ncbi:Arc family DNA-binding protein [Delftia acidovorans]|uniref:Arc family DNA-binding protein n=1 Tax=Delftia acidovorans TaxID=80866 RepID=UPI00286F20F1|nr:Arc family DNA-binding protein [Delftia acidovorans]